MAKKAVGLLAMDLLECFSVHTCNLQKLRDNHRYEIGADLEVYLSIILRDPLKKVRMYLVKRNYTEKWFEKHYMKHFSIYTWKTSDPGGTGNIYCSTIKFLMCDYLLYSERFLTMMTVVKKRKRNHRI